MPTLDRAEKSINLKGALLHPSSLILAYAIFDVARTGIATYQFITEAVSEGVQVVGPMHFMVGSSLFLIAAVGCFIGRKLGYSAGVVGGLFVLYLGFCRWEAIARAIEVSMRSWAVFTYWWTTAGPEWEFPRFILSAILVWYASVSLLRANRQRGPRR
jgi:hypothetical protein